MSGDERRGVSEPRGQYGSSSRPVSAKTASFAPYCVFISAF